MSITRDISSQEKCQGVRDGLETFSDLLELCEISVEESVTAGHMKDVQAHEASIIQLVRSDKRTTAIMVICNYHDWLIALNEIVKKVGLTKFRDFEKDYRNGLSPWEAIERAPEAERTDGDNRTAAIERKRAEQAGQVRMFNESEVVI